MNVIVIALGFLFFAFGVPILVLGNLRYKEEHNFQRTKCLNVFDIGGNELNSFTSFTKFYVKCPKCGRYAPLL